MSKARDLADLGAVTDRLDTVGASDGALSNRNLIINGAMQVAQRGTSLTSSNNSNYLAVDRFVYDTRVNGASSGDFTLEQVTDAPTGFQYSYKITNVDNTTVSSSGGVEFMQFIEGYNVAHLKWGTSEAKGVTFSFWVKASYTGTQSIYFPSSDYGIVWLDSFTINAANTWEYKTFYIEGPTSGTWSTTTGRGIMARINICNGASVGPEKNWNQSNVVVSGQTNTFGTTTSSTFQVTGVQLEVGDTATPFEHRSYGDELARCSRYAHVLKPEQAYGRYRASFNDIGTGCTTFYEFPVEMRSVPTLTNNNMSSSTFQCYSETDGGFRNPTSAFTLGESSKRHAYLACLTATATAGAVGMWRWNNNPSASMVFDAEL